LLLPPIALPPRYMTSAAAASDGDLLIFGGIDPRGFTNHLFHLDVEVCTSGTRARAAANATSSTSRLPPSPGQAARRSASGPLSPVASGAASSHAITHTNGEGGPPPQPDIGPESVQPRESGLSKSSSDSTKVHLDHFEQASDGVFDEGNAARVLTNLSGEVAGQPPPPRSSMGLATSGGILYLFGGSGENGKLNDLFNFDPSLNTWTMLNVSSPPSARMGHAMVADEGGSFLYVWGGKDLTGDFPVLLHRLDVANLKWQIMPADAPPRGRRWHGMVLLADALYVFGGVGSGGQFTNELCGRFCGWSVQDTLSDLYRYSLTNQSWTLLSSGCGGGDGASAAVRNGWLSPGVSLRDHKERAASGGSFNGKHTGVTGDWFDDLSSKSGRLYGQAGLGDTEMDVVPGPMARDSMGMAALGNCLYVYGGEGPQGQNFNSAMGYFADLLRFCPAVGVWEDLTSVVSGEGPGARWGQSMAAVNGMLVVFGGFSGALFTSVKDLYAFDPDNLRWRRLDVEAAGTGPSRRDSVGLAAASGRVYIFGGNFYTGLVLSVALGDLWGLDVPRKVTC